jgi:SecD/SecF fusion protein
MAVDANILILERSREELKAGKSTLTALTAGFDKAFSTIMDANVTTLITAGLLAWLGTGPVKGFGVTLSIGIFGTLFCALIVNRWMLELLVSRGLMKRILGFEMFSDFNVPFLNYARPAFIFSWCVVAIGLVATFFH